MTVECSYPNEPFTPHLWSLKLREDHSGVDEESVRARRTSVKYLQDRMWTLYLWTLYAVATFTKPTKDHIWWHEGKDEGWVHEASLLVVDPQVVNGCFEKIQKTQGATSTCIWTKLIGSSGLYVLWMKLLKVCCRNLLTDWSLVLWGDWNVACPESNYLILD